MCLLLLQARITNLSCGDRNFHIFYQLLSGADIHLLSNYVKVHLSMFKQNFFILEGLKLQRNVEHYVILQTEGNQPTQTESEDKNLFVYTRTALDILGFSIEEVVNIFRIIAIILKLGNLQFVPCNNIDGTEGCVIDNDYGV